MARWELHTRKNGWFVTSPHTMQKAFTPEEAKDYQELESKLDPRMVENTRTYLSCTYNVRGLRTMRGAALRDKVRARVRKAEAEYEKEMEQCKSTQ
jgi:hypothetical protein